MLTDWRSNRKKTHFFLYMGGRAFRLSGDRGRPDASGRLTRRLTLSITMYDQPASHRSVSDFLSHSSKERQWPCGAGAPSEGGSLGVYLHRRIGSSVSLKTVSVWNLSSDLGGVAGCWWSTGGSDLGVSGSVSPGYWDSSQGTSGAKYALQPR